MDVVIRIRPKKDFLAKTISENNEQVKFGGFNHSIIFKHLEECDIEKEDFKDFKEEYLTELALFYI